MNERTNNQPTCQRCTNEVRWDDSKTVVPFAAFVHVANNDVECPLAPEAGMFE